MSGFLPQHSDCQDVAVLPQIRVWCSLFFVVIFSAFLGFPGRVCSVVGASVCAATIYRCGARHSHRCHLLDHIPSSLRSSCSFLRLIFLDPLSPSEQGVRVFIFLLEFFLAQKSSLDRAPRWESDWITWSLDDAIVSPTLYILWHPHVQHALVLHMLRQFR